MIKHPFVIALIASAVAAACQAGNEDGKFVASDGAIRALEKAELSLAETARGVLADELQLPVSTITIDSVRAVEWRDSSIGCPQPGQAYGQVITPGHKITLRSEGSSIHVLHAANGKPFICRRSKTPVDVAPSLEFSWAPQAALARIDLAKHLRVTPDKIIVANAKRKTWADLAMDCPEQGQTYQKQRTDGYVLTLRHGSKDFTYHTDMDRVIACPMISES
ncbi:MAG: hypothetical protein AB8F65_04465 [Woeseiaceae bacterium]